VPSHYYLHPSVAFQFVRACTTCIFLEISRPFLLSEQLEACVCAVNTAVLRQLATTARHLSNATMLSSGFCAHLLQLFVCFFDKIHFPLHAKPVVLHARIHGFIPLTSSLVPPLLSADQTGTVFLHHFSREGTNRRRDHHHSTTN
jgi:hypothetical protein